MYTAWASVFPTAAYNYNEFFNAGQRFPFSVCSLTALTCLTRSNPNVLQWGQCWAC